MATAESVKAQLESLLAQANRITGRDDATLTEAVAALAAGFGQGGGDSADSTDSIIDRSITSITSNVAEVGQYAFYGCEHLETASFPEAMTIYGGAFVGCKALVSISGPKVTEIKSDVTSYTDDTEMDGGMM